MAVLGNITNGTAVQSQFIGGSSIWSTYSGTPGLANAGTNVTFSNTGIVKLTGGTVAKHILDTYRFKVTFGVSGITSTPWPVRNATLKIGVLSEQGGAYARDIYFVIEGQTSRCYYEVAGNYPNNPPTNLIRTIPANFDWNGAEVDMRFKDNTLITTLTDTINHKVHTFKYKFLVKVHAGPAVGSFAISHIQGSTNFNEISSVSITSNTPLAPDCVFIGDSIPYGSRNRPIEGRFANLIANQFRANSNPKVITVMSSGSAKTQHMIDIAPSIITINPKCLVIHIGDNDLKTDVTGWWTTYISMVNTYTGAGIPVVLYGPPNDSNDLHDLFRTKWLSDLMSTVNDPTLVKGMIDIMPLMGVGGDISQQIPGSTVDGAHLTDLGNTIYRDATYPLLATII